MNRQWRKNGISLLIIVIIMALLTTACGGGASKGESSPSDNTSGDEPVKLSIFIASRATDEMYTNETLVWKEIGKKI